MIRVFKVWWLGRLDAGCEPLEQLFRGHVASDAGRA
jgi:hypothetical protein